MDDSALFSMPHQRLNPLTGERLRGLTETERA
jgi:hypothetical protein